jgi:hypothetical protein
LFDGAVHVMVARAFPGVALGAVGAPGKVAGTNVLDALDGALVPMAFVAVTRQV